MRVKCLAQEHNTMTRPGLEPGPFDPESSAALLFGLSINIRAWGINIIMIEKKKKRKKNNNNKTKKNKKDIK